MRERKLRISLPIRIGILLLVGFLVIFSGGYFTYMRLTEVVNSIHRDKYQQTGLPAIRYVSTSIEQAENYMRLYGITGNRSYMEDYSELTGSIDSSIQVLYSHYPDDDWFTARIDTINTLFEHKKVLWHEMISIWQRGASASDISDLTEEIRSEGASEDSTRRLLARLFSGRKNEQTFDDEAVIERLNALEHEEKQFESNLTRQEIELALTSNMLTEAFISLMEQLEAYEMKVERENMERADELSGEAYQLMTVLSLFGVGLGLFGLIILLSYIRKNQAYNRVLVRSRQAAEELAKSKEQFIANVSHEIRTPLNAINGFIKQLLSGNIDREVKNKLEIVDSAGDQLIRLINDVLDFSKLQAGSLDLHPVHFNPAVVVQEACSIFSGMAAENGNIIESDVEDVGELALYGDIQRFQQILYNLLSNAVKFTREGTIGVLATLKERSEDRMVLKIAVTDTGLGIEASKMDKIFEEYSQADQDMTIRYGGTGLGLSIVKRLVDLFNGEINVESKKGVGTTVTCLLEFSEGKHDHIQHKKPAGVKYTLPEGLRVLVADDEPYNQELMAMILRKWKIDFDTAKNGLEAIELLKKNKYDVVLMDIRMPVINGVMATQFIRDTLKRPREEVIVIGITADITRHQTSEVSELFNTLLVKPFTEEELHRAITLETKTGEAATGVADVDPKETDADIEGLVRASGNDKDFIKEMIGRFKTSTLRGLEEIREAAEHESYDEIDDLAHRMAPPARHLGAGRLLNVIGQIREDSKNKAADRILEHAEEANKITLQVVEHLEEQYRALTE